MSLVNESAAGFGYLDQEKRIKKLLTGSLWTTSSSLSSRIIPILLVITLAHFVEPAELGVYSFVVAAYSVIALFADLGIAYSLPKFMQESLNSAASLSATSVTLRFICSLLVAIICWIADYFWGVFQGYGFLVGLLLFSSAFGIVTFSLNARLKFREANVLVILRNFCWFILAILMVFLGWRVEGPIYGLAVAFIISGVLVLALEGGEFYLGFDLKLVLKILKYGLYVMTASGLNVLTAQAGILGLAYLTTAQDVGIFKIAVTFGTAPMFLADAIILPILPLVKQGLAEGPKGGDQLMQTISRFLILLIFPIVGLGIFIADPFVMLVFGPKYANAVSPLQILLIANALGTLFSVIIAASYMTGDMKGLTKISAAVAGLNLSGTLLLIPWMGSKGAAISLCLANATGLFLLIIWLRRRWYSWIDWGRAAIFLMCFGEMLVLTWAVISLIPGLKWRLTGGIIIPPLIYLSALLIHRGIKPDELVNLFGPQKIGS